MTPEEQEFHDKWLAIFIELERETVFGIGFNPRSIEQYTPEVVTKCMATYRSRKRFRPTPLFRSIVKWTLGLGTAVCVTLVAVDQVLETNLQGESAIIAQHEEYRADWYDSLNRMYRKVVNAENRAEAARLKAVKLQEQKDAREEAACKAVEAKKAAKRKSAITKKAAKDEACLNAQSFYCDSVIDNKIHGSTYLKGERIRCTITLKKKASKFKHCRVDGGYRRVKSIGVFSVNRKPQKVFIRYPYKTPNFSRADWTEIPIHSIKAREM